MRVSNLFDVRYLALLKAIIDLSSGSSHMQNVTVCLSSKQVYASIQQTQALTLDLPNSRFILLING